jgi:membrane-associated protease RseP (regulator of RpoE activity)
LSVGGYGSSPLWSQLITNVTDKNLEVKLDSTAGTTGDQVPFYRKDIPVLFLHTGNHTDFHKATDDVDKINYDALLHIGKYLSRVIEFTDGKGKISFAKAPEPVTMLAKTTVSLGIIPDNTSNDGGLKINGVSSKKIAEKIGLQPGDVLTKLGSYSINDMNSYILALSNFKAGDRTTLKIKRGKEDREFAVEF